MGRVEGPGSGRAPNRQLWSPLEKPIRAGHRGRAEKAKGIKKYKLPVITVTRCQVQHREYSR